MIMDDAIQLKTCTEHAAKMWNMGLSLCSSFPRLGCTPHDTALFEQHYSPSSEPMRDH